MKKFLQLILFAIVFDFLFIGALWVGGTFLHWIMPQFF